jgi:hypothetical protein
MVNYMLTTIAKSPQVSNLWIPADGTGGWPTYYGRESDPIYSVKCSWDDQSAQPCSVESYSGHAPVGAEIQGGDPDAKGDRHLTFIDQFTGYEYYLWAVSFTGWPTVRSPFGAGGGDVSTLWSGYTNAMSGAGRAIGVGQGNDGRVGNLAGRIRVEELISAIAGQSFINHALTIEVNCTNGRSVYPASTVTSGRPCHAIGLDDANAPPMGARIYLAMTFAQINALPVPEWKRVILRTLSKYGGIINDTGVDGYFVVQTESGNQYTSMNVADKWLAFASCMKSGLNCAPGIGPEADWDCADSTTGTCQNGLGNYTGLFQDSNDGLNTWTTQVWNNLKVLDPCVSDGTCNP